MEKLLHVNIVAKVLHWKQICYFIKKLMNKTNLSVVINVIKHTNREILYENTSWEVMTILPTLLVLNATKALHPGKKIHIQIASTLHYESEIINWAALKSSGMSRSASVRTQNLLSASAILSSKSWNFSENCCMKYFITNSSRISLNRHWYLFYVCAMNEYSWNFCQK